MLADGDDGARLGPILTFCRCSENRTSPPTASFSNPPSVTAAPTPPR